PSPDREQYRSDRFLCVTHHVETLPASRAASNSRRLQSVCLPPDHHRRADAWARADDGKLSHVFRNHVAACGRRIPVLCALSRARRVLALTHGKDGMPSIDLIDVSVDFPIYTAQTRSIRADLLRRIGGRIQEKEDHSRFVVNALRNINLNLQAGDRLGLI